MANCYSLYRFWLAIWLMFGTSLLAQAQTTCPAPTSLTAFNITMSSATVSLTGPANATAYHIMYAPLGVPPVLAIVYSSTSLPVTLPGLVPNTTYWVCAYNTCSPGSQSAQTCGLTFTTRSYPVTAWPYLETFDNTSAPTLPMNYSVLDANNDGHGWANVASTYAKSPANVMQYTGSATQAADDWFFTTDLAMQASKTYQLMFSYRALAGTAPQALEVKAGPAATPAGQSQLLFTNSAITNTTYALVGAGQVLRFTPPTSGIYFVGFHATSPASASSLFVDDIMILEATPLATAGGRAAGFSVEAAPVPFSNRLTISLTTQQAGPLQLTLHDAVGRVVRQHNATVPAGASTMAMPDVAALPAGLYLLAVRQGGATQIIRVAHE